MYRLSIYIYSCVCVSSSDFFKVTLQAEPFPTVQLLSVQKGDKRGSAHGVLRSLTYVSIFFPSNVT